ncbi:hypothetical protein [Lysinibacillus sphaericus]|uniref:hypothetical protein n=1 Tax=Lysinibacillus sphaericus TaxID=1421 RepID=UPI003D041B6C
MGFTDSKPLELIKSLKILGNRDGPEKFWKSSVIINAEKADILILPNKKKMT